MKHHVGEQVDSARRIFAQHGGMIHGSIFVGVGVQVAPYPLEIVDDGCRRATLGALKRHVLVIVGHALFVGALVAGTHLQGVATIHYVRGRLAVYHAQAIR